MNVTRGSFAMVALAISLAGTAHGAEVPITAEARQHFTAGVNLLKDQEGARYEEAYREFKAAYAASPSPKILGNLGLCAMKLERDGEAIEAYTKYLSEGDLEATEKKQITTDLATLKSGVTKALIAVSVPGATLTDVRVTSRGERIINVYGPLKGPLELGIRPGHHQITAKLAGHDDQVWEMDANPGGKESHTFTMKKQGGAPPPPPPPTATAPATTAPPPPPPAAREVTRPTPTGVYIGLGTAGVLFAGGALTGILALSKKSDFDKKNDGTDPNAAQSARDSGKTMGLVTDLLLGGALIAGGITTYLYVSRPEQPASAARITVTPSVGPGVGGFSLRGAF